MKLIFNCFNFLLKISFPSLAICFLFSLIDDLIADLAFEVTTKSNQLALGFELLLFMICTCSPLLSLKLSGTIFPFTLIPLVFKPKPECMWKAKSSAVEPFGSDFKSPSGVKTKISSEYKLSLKSSTKLTALVSGFLRTSCNLFNHFSNPLSLSSPTLYL